MTRPYAVTTEPGDLAASARPAARRPPCTLEVVAGNAPAYVMFAGGASAPLDRSYYHAIEPGAAGRFDLHVVRCADMGLGSAAVTACRDYSAGEMMRIRCDVELRDGGEDSPGRLVGTIMRYGAAGVRGREVFAPGALQAGPTTASGSTLDHASSPARGSVQAANLADPADSLGGRRRGPHRCAAA